MRVLVLAQYFAPDMGGGSTRATNVVKGLLGNGCGVHIYISVLKQLRHPHLCSV